MTDRDRVDVLIVGAGASGAAVAWSLAEAGIQVLCLEQGGWVAPEAYPTARDDWELHRQTDFHPDPNVRGLPADYPLNTSASPIDPLMYNAVGGSTIHWSAHFPRFRPSDFRVRSLDGVADDWPLTYGDLEPFFDLNDRMMGVAGLTGDPAYPPKSPRQTPPIPIGRLGHTIVRGFEKLGWHWWPSDSAIITAPYDGRRACNNCGPCDVGCPVGAKASTDITYWPKALARGARAADGRAGARDHRDQGRPRRRRGLPRPPGTGARAEGQDRHPRLQRGRDAAPAPQLAVVALSRRARQRDGPGGPQPHVPSRMPSRVASSTSGWRDTRDPTAAPSSARSSTRPTAPAASSAATPSRSRAA